MKIKKDSGFPSQTELYLLGCFTLTCFHFACVHFFVCFFFFFFFSDQQMLSSNPQIYSCSLPSAFQADLPNLQKLCAHSRLPSPPLHRLSKLWSARGEAFFHFVKSHSFVDGKKNCCHPPYMIKQVVSSQCIL